MKLLSISNDAKTVKGESQGYITGVMYLAPSDASGLINTCPHASKGCRIACLFSAGRGAFNNVRQARIDRTRFLVENPDAFFTQLTEEIASLVRKAYKENLIPVIRLNGTSDLPFHIMGGESMMARFPALQYYDYTKDHKKMMSYLAGKLPSNYDMTFSLSESNRDKANEVLANGGRVAVVFKDKLPDSYDTGRQWGGYSVINGDMSDLRFLDSGKVIVGLSAKGKAKKDESGFVI